MDRRHRSELEQLEERTLLSMPPTVSAGADVMISEGGELATSGFFTDPDMDNWAAIVDYGDGAGVEPLTLNPDKTFNLSHLYADSGEFTVTVTVTDGVDGFGSDTLMVRAENVAPTAELSVVSPVDEGGLSIISFDGQSDPSDADKAAGFHYAFSCSGEDLSGTSYLAAGLVNLIICSFDDGPSQHTVRARIIDKDDGFTEYTMGVTVKNVPPSSLDLTLGSKPISENGFTTISGSFADPGTLDTHEVVIDWGGGSAGQRDEGSTTIILDAVELSFSATHQYRDDSPDRSPSDLYTITVTVTDKDGASASGSTDLTVNNVAPSGLELILVENLINEDGLATISGSFADPGTLDTHEVVIQWGGGESGQLDEGNTEIMLEPGVLTFIRSHQYRDDNPTGTTFDPYTVTVTVTDKDGASTFDTRGLTVANVPPMVNVGPDVAILEGDTLAVAGRVPEPGDDMLTAAGFFIDPGTDTWTAVVNYGDGSGVQPLSLNPDKTFNLSHPYADNGEFTVTVLITDDDGDVGSDSLAVTVNNVAPVVSAGEDVDISPGVLAAIGSFADPSDDTWTATVNYGDGSGAESLPLNPDNSFYLIHSYANIGDYTVTVTVTDDDGGIGRDSLVVRVMTRMRGTNDQGVTVVEDLTIDGPTSDDPFATDWQLVKSTSIRTFAYFSEYVKDETTGKFILVPCYRVVETQFFSAELVANGSSVDPGGTFTGGCSRVFVDEFGRRDILNPAMIIVRTLSEVPPASEYWEKSGNALSDDGRNLTLSAYRLPFISGTVFEDHNGNGTRDAEDQPVAGATVHPFASFCCLLFRESAGDTSLAFKLAENEGVTDSLGQYNFLVFRPGLVSFDLRLLDDGTGPEVVATGDRTVLLPQISGAMVSRDVGAFFRAGVSGQVYEDHNGNGLRDPEDGAFTRFPIPVQPDNNSDGRFDATDDCTQPIFCSSESFAITNNQGGYRVLGPGNFSLTGPTDLSGEPTYTITEGSAGHAARSGEEIANANFGFFLNVPLLGGQVYEDGDNSGALDSHDTLLPGVTIRLDLNNDGTVDQTTVSGELGLYRFDNVGPGTHRVSQALGPGVDQTQPCDEYVLEMRSGELIGRLDFGRRTATIARSALAAQVADRAGGVIAAATQGICRLPDIAVTRATRVEGNRIAFDFTTKNQPGAFQVGVYQSANETFDADPRVDVPVGKLIQITPALGGGAQQANFTLPRNFQRDPTRPRLIVVADPANSIVELAENNNVRVVEVTADIAITAARRENTTLRNSPQIVTVTFGLANNPGPFELGLYRSADFQFDAGDVALPNSVRRITPAVGATDGQELFNIGSYTADPGKPFLIVAVDPNKQVDEKDEMNNVARVGRMFDTSPLGFAGNFSYNEREDRFEAGGVVQIGFAPTGNDPLIPVAIVNGTVFYNDDEFLATGVVSAVVGNRLERLFEGTLEVDLPDAASIKLERTQSNLDFSLAGSVFDYSRVAFVKNAAGQGQLALQGQVTLPLLTPSPVVSGVKVKIDGVNSVRLGPDAVQVTGGRIVFPDVEFDLKGLKVEATEMSIEYIPSPPVAPSLPLQDALRIQGKLNLDFEKFFKTVVNPTLPPQQTVNASFYKIAADFAGDNYIEIKRDGTINVVGSVSFDNAAAPIIPGVLILQKGKCTVNSVENDYRCEVGVKLPLIHPDLVFLGGFGFKNGDPNFVLVGVENTNLPIAALPGWFFQKVAVFGDNLSNPSPAAQEVGATVGFTFGPQFSIPVIPFVTEMPFNAVSLFNLEATGKFSRQHLVITGDLKVVHEDVAALSGECDLIFSNATANPPTAWMLKCKGSANIFKTAVVGRGTLTIDRITNTLVSQGTGQLQLPKVGGTFLRGQQIADGQFYVQIKVNATTSDDFGLLYATFDFPILGSLTIGIKVSLDGGFEVLTNLVEIQAQIPRSASTFARSAAAFPREAVPPGTSSLLLTAEWDNDVGPVAVELVAPDGRVIPESAFDGIDIGVIPELSDGTLKSVGIRNPAPGDWLIRVVNTDGLGEVVYNAYIPAAPPTIELNSASVFANSATVNYVAADPDSTATVSLFYDTDGEDFDGVFIADGLAETDGAGVFQFDSSSIPDGVYHLYAMIDDGNNAPVFDYLDQPVTVDHTPPTVANVELLPDAARKKLAAFAVTFSEDMAAAGVSSTASATAAANFKIQTAGRDKRLGTADDVFAPIRSVTYDAATRTARVTPNVSLALNQFYQFSVLSTATLTDAAGNSLDGDLNGALGGNFVTAAGLGTRFKYTDLDNDAVSITLTGGGLAQLARDATGEGRDLRVTGASSASVLTGSVKRPRTGATPQNGTTTIQSIVGLGAGQNRLANPPFNVPTATIAAAIDEVLGLLAPVV